MTLRIAIAGAAGRMGRALVRAARDDARFEIVGGAERAGSPALGADIGELAGAGPINVVATADVPSASAHADVWIDFTAPEATLSALDKIGARAAVIGTTGLSPEQEDGVAKAAARIAIVRSNNFSLGVNLLAALVRQAASKLGPEWDIEITEAHHRRKVDAPSGTALLLGEAAADGRGKSLKELRLPNYESAREARREGGIGFSVIRAGGLVGDHDVRFGAEREVLTLSHRALDRGIFADGALAAAAWAADKPPGLYTMREVLGL